MSWYLAPTTAVPEQYRHVIGLLDTLGGQHDVSRWSVWALDNGCFSGRWTEDKWLALLNSYSPDDKRSALFAVVPDVVGDAAATLDRFKRYAPIVRSHGYPLALATQDGLRPSMVPWVKIDALFIGGTDKHKRGQEGDTLIAEGKRRDKWVHVGRVNSRLAIRRFWMADSWDGTALAFEPSIPRIADIAGAVLEVRAKKELQLCLL